MLSQCPQKLTWDKILSYVPCLNEHVTIRWEDGFLTKRCVSVFLRVNGGCGILGHSCTGDEGDNGVPVAFQRRSAEGKSFRIVVGVLEWRNEHTEFISARGKVVPPSDRRSGMAEWADGIPVSGPGDYPCGGHTAECTTMHRTTGDEEGEKSDDNALSPLPLLADSGSCPWGSPLSPSRFSESSVAVVQNSHSFSIVSFLWVLHFLGLFAFKGFQ